MQLGRDHDAREEDGASAPRLPVLCGADVELGNFVLGARDEGSSCRAAAAALLREIRGVPHRAPGGGGAAQGPAPPYRDAGGYGSCNVSERSDEQDPRDRDRKFLPSNGGSAYIDLDHLELCLPEVRSAREHVACWHAMLRIGQRALGAANARMRDGRRIHALVNNSDGRGNAYGSHLDFLVSRRTWDNLLERKVQLGLFLASYQASSIVFTGQGKVGSENGTPWVPYQLSQRADFFETLMGPATMSHRPLVNSRDEPLCGIRAYSGLPGASMARLHVIFYDSNLSQVACFLKVGVFQIVLAMLAAERAALGLALDDPVEAVVRFSHDPGLRATARTLDGRDLTALDHQRLVFDRAARFVADGGCEEIVPEAEEILTLWHDTLVKLEARDADALASRLDWALKLALLHRALGRKSDLAWTSPEVRHLDQVYASLCPDEGLYWACARSGHSTPVVAEEEIVRLESQPPETTRAWTRAMLLRRAGAAVEAVDWDEVRVRLRGGRWSRDGATVELADPLRFGRGEAEPAFRDARSLEDLVLRLNVLARSSPAVSAGLGGNQQVGGRDAIAAAAARTQARDEEEGIP